MAKKKLDLQKIDPITLPDDPVVKENYISTYMAVHQKTDLEAEGFYSKESIYYKQLLIANEKLKVATKISLYSAFLEGAINGLSLQGGSKAEAYLESRNVNQGTRDKAAWVSIAFFRIQAYGELTMRIRAGQILHAYNPIIVYEGDKFQPRTNESGDLIVDYEPVIPRKSKKIVASFIRLALKHDKYDYKWLTVEDIDRLKKASCKALRNDTGNALYSSGEDGQIDVGFLEAKTIKFAFRSYPKLKVGESAAIEDEDPTINENFDSGENTNVATPVINETDLAPDKDEAGKQTSIGDEEEPF